MRSSIVQAIQHVNIKDHIVDVNEMMSNSEIPNNH